MLTVILCLNSQFLGPKLRFMVLKNKIKFANIMIYDPNKVKIDHINM